MIEAKELRLGIIVKTSFQEVYEWGALDFWEGTEYEPIPLTEEWLNKTPIEWNGNYNIIIDGWLELECYTDDDVWVLYINGKKISFEYIHQLQNFFSTSGEELTIKE